MVLSEIENRYPSSKYEIRLEVGDSVERLNLKTSLWFERSVWNDFLAKLAILNSEMGINADIHIAILSDMSEKFNFYVCRNKSTLSLEIVFKFKKHYQNYAINFCKKIDIEFLELLEGAFCDSEQNI